MVKLVTSSAYTAAQVGEELKVAESIVAAAKYGVIEVVKQNLDDGADVNAKDDNIWSGRTLLHYAAEEGHKEMAELLMAEGANVNAKDNWGSTPLLPAADWGRKEVVALLISNGADVNAKDNCGGLHCILRL